VIRCRAIVVVSCERIGSMAHEVMLSGGVHHRNLGSEESSSSSSSSYPPSLLLTDASYGHSGRFAASSGVEGSPQFQYVSEKQQSRILSPHPELVGKPSLLTRGLASLTTPRDGSPYAFSRMYAAVRSATNTEEAHAHGELSRRRISEDASFADDGFRGLVARILRPGNRPGKRLLVLILLNVAYSTTELLIGILTRRMGRRYLSHPLTSNPSAAHLSPAFADRCIPRLGTCIFAGLVSDAFHLSFGCGVLTFSLVAMTWSDHPPDKAFTYGYIN
jgi:hypothetical protein